MREYRLTHLLPSVAVIAFSLASLPTPGNAQPLTTELPRPEDNANTPEPEVRTPRILPETTRLDDRRPLAVGDTISYRVVEEGDETFQLTVASNGEIDFPLVGRIAAEGRTCRQVADEVKSRLEKSFLWKATVLVALDDASTIPLGSVVVTGQVPSPGLQEIPRDRTLTVSAAVLGAGGFADFADRRRVRLVRPRPDGTTERFTIDVKAILEKGEISRDMELQPGDYVVVPERMFNF